MLLLTPGFLGNTPMRAQTNPSACVRGSSLCPLGHHLKIGVLMATPRPTISCHRAPGERARSIRSPSQPTQPCGQFLGPLQELSAHSHSFPRTLLPTMVTILWPSCHEGDFRVQVYLRDPDHSGGRQRECEEGLSNTGSVLLRPQKGTATGNGEAQLQDQKLS